MNIVKPNPYGKLSPEQLAAFEKEVRAKLPEDYRKYLLEFNGGKWSKKLFLISDEEGYSSIHHVYGLHDGPLYCRLDAVLANLKAPMGSLYLPIAEDDGGNKICIGIRDENFGKIYFWDHEIDAVVQVASSFGDFVDSLSAGFASADELKDVLENDDVTRMQEIVSAGYDIESVDEHGRSLIERAAISAKPKLIEYLARAGADFGKSLELAKKNSEYFEEHRLIVELISRLKSELVR